MRPTVLIVDDHVAFREAARQLLTADGFQVVGLAADGHSALDAVTRLRPGVVLLDIQLPDLDGFAVAAELAARDDPPDVVFVSSREAIDFGDAIEQASARGFLAKRDLSGAALDSILG